MNSGKLLRWSLVVVAGVLLAAAGTACQQTTRLITEPEGAEVWVNNINMGESPALYQTRSGTPATYYVRVRKEGYEEVKNATIESSYRADVSLLLLLAAIVPYFFSARLEDQYSFHLVPLPGTMPPVTSAAQPKQANWGGAELKSGPAPNPGGRAAPTKAPEPPPESTVPAPPPLPDQLTPPEKG